MKGTSFPEAVRIFAKQSVAEQGMPFTMHLTPTKTGRTLGIANGKYNIQDDIDKCKAEIASMYGVDEE